MDKTGEKKKAKYLRVPLRVVEDEENCGLGGCMPMWYIRDADNNNIAEVYDDVDAHEIVRACNEFYR